MVAAGGHLKAVATQPPLISVVMPVFNAERYVEEAVRSMLAQTVTDFELILLNDGSTDGTLPLLQQLQAQDDRIILVSRENRGLVATLNEGLALAQGQWIARMDADDIALAHRFERQLQWLEQTGADICGTGVQFFGANEKRILMHPCGDVAIKIALFFGSVFAHPTVMMRATLAKQLGYEPAWEKCEDYDLWQRAAQAHWKMANVPEVLLMYRVHEAQISTVSLSYQQELAQHIRRRQWTQMQSAFGIQPGWSVEVLKLRELDPPSVDLDDVNAALGALARQATTDEARGVLLDHARRLYVRSAGNSRDVVRSWQRLLAQVGVKTSISTLVQLALLSLFRLGPTHAVFGFWKKVALNSQHFLGKV